MKHEEIFDRYSELGNSLSQLMGKLLEVAVVEKKSDKLVIRNIYNEQVTSRREGQQIVDPALSSTSAKGSEVRAGINQINNRFLKSINHPIADEKGQTIGFCVFTMDVTYFKQVSQFLSAFVQTDDTDEDASKNAIRTPAEEIQSEIERILNQNNWLGRQLASKEKRALVKTLYERGHFNKRGAVSIVSNELNLTRPSVYKYLKESV